MAPVKRCRLIHCVAEKIAAMEFHGEVGILKQVSGEHQHYGFIGLHKSLPQQFLKAGESDGGAGSQPIPSAPISALACAISSSLTWSQAPPVA